MSNPPIPYWRISGFYLFYFASLGVLVPYWTLYLQSLHFDGREIGELMAILMATKFIAPYIWGWIADHTGKGMLVIRIGSVLSVIVFIAVFFTSSYWWMVLIMALFSFFWNATLPQFEANTMNHLGSNTHRYSVIRLWGSCGFILSVVLIGYLIDDTGLFVIPAGIMFFFVLIAVFSFLVPAAPEQKHADQQGAIIHVLKQPVVIALLLVCFLAQMSHGPYYTFYSIFLKQHGYSGDTLGWLWALGVAAEIVVFLYMHKLMPMFGARKLLMLALLLTAVRWYLIGHFIDQLSVILLAQLLHAASFGLYHAVAIDLFHRFFKGKYQGRGQALYSSVSFGAGGALGSYASGLMWDKVEPAFLFNLASAIALLAFFITWRFIHLQEDRA
jgi:PPP family 3-phenylpropionic acid transporter